MLISNSNSINNFFYNNNIFHCPPPIIASMRSPSLTRQQKTVALASLQRLYAPRAVGKSAVNTNQKTNVYSVSSCPSSKPLFSLLTLISVKTYIVI